MMRQLFRPSHPPRVSTLHSVWTLTIVKLLALMVGLAIVAVGMVQYQRTALNNSTMQIEKTVSTQAALTRALLRINTQPAIAMMYGTSNTVTPAEVRARYQVIRANLNAAFAAASHATPDPALRTILSRARQTWQALDAAVLTAPGLVAPAAVAQAVAKGNDPNQVPVWDRYTAISIDLSELSAESAVVIREHSVAQLRTGLLLLPAILASLLVALLLAWIAVRRMKRQVLSPLLELRQAALTMRESKLDGTIEISGGTIELRDLAAALNETSAALGTTHRVLRDQAYTDPLTSLPNRKALIEHLRAKLAEPGNHQLGVLFVDLDDFKDINDTLGHASGDELLSIVARRLRSGTRDNEFVARLGGDEFAIIVDCGDRPDEALIVAQRTVAALNEPLKICDTTTTVSCSIGIATSDAEAGPSAADELLRNADFAMYMAKSQGKNCFDVFAPSMHADMLGRTELKRDLSQAVQLDQLVLYYQPIVDLSTGALQGFEALIRWQHPIRGLLAPSEFIPLAEDTGDIIEIGTWVFDQACGYLAALHRDIPGTSTLQMSVDVSAHQISGPPFVDIVKKALDRHGLSAGTIIIEITEAVAITNTEVAVQTLTELRGHGVRIALDDFGTGYSSLRYLHELPIDIIKIDRSVVMAPIRTSAAMLQALVTLGQSLGLAIVVKGIETPAELERLHRFDHLAGQGYLFARPMPAAESSLFAAATPAQRNRLNSVWQHPLPQRADHPFSG